MDAPYKQFGPSHRWMRHNAEDIKNPPKAFIEKYGLVLTRNIMYDHAFVLDKKPPKSKLQAQHNPWSSTKAEKRERKRLQKMHTSPVYVPSY